MQKFNTNKYLLSLAVYFLSLTTATAQSGLDSTVTSLAISGQGPTMYAGTSQGLYVSSNSGRDWMNAGLDGRNITDIVVHPENQAILYAAMGNDGIVKSFNSGKDWTALDIRLPPSARMQAHGDIRAITIDSASPSTLYAASFQGFIFKSIDEGQSWSVLNDGFPLQALNALAVDPQTGTIYAGTGGNGIYKTTNNGVDWIAINNGLDDMTVTRVVIDPVDSGTLFAGTYGGGVYTSQNQGQSWMPANTGLSGTYVYALTAYPYSAASNNMTGLFNQLKQTITGAAGMGAELYVGVYGVDLYKASISHDLHWQPLADVSSNM